MITNLVFSGGGVKCISYIGLLKYFEENNMMKDIKNIAGNIWFNVIIRLFVYWFKNLIVSLDFQHLQDILVVKTYLILIIILV